MNTIEQINNEHSTRYRTRGGCFDLLNETSCMQFIENIITQKILRHVTANKKTKNGRLEFFDTRNDIIGYLNCINKYTNYQGKYSQMKKGECIKTDKLCFNNYICYEIDEINFNDYNSVSYISKLIIVFALDFYKLGKLELRDCPEIVEYLSLLRQKVRGYYEN